MEEEHESTDSEQEVVEQQEVESPQMEDTTDRSSQSFEETNKLLRDHMALLQAQQQRPPKQEAQETQFADDDLMTVGMAKKALRDMQRQNEELRVAAKHKDYEEVITKFLPEAIKENPNIRYWIESSESPYEQAYYLAKKSDAYLKEMAVKTRSKDAEKIVKNNRSTGNLSSIGTNSSARGTVDYKNMSDDEFRMVAARNMRF